MGKTIVVGLILMCVVYSCSFGAVSGYKSAGARRDVHILSENSMHLFSDNHALSDNKLNSDNQNDGGGWGGILVLGGIVVFLVVVLKNKGGSDE